MKKSLLLVLLIFNQIILSATEPNYLWVFKTNGRIYASPAISGNLLLCGSGDSSFYAIDKFNGQELWKFDTGGPVYSDAGLNAKSVFFGSADGKLYSLDINSGKLNWKFASEGEKILDMWDYYQSSPKIYQGLVYWGSGDGHLYAIDSQTGELKWKFKSGGNIHATPVIDKGIVYIGDYAGFFYALDAITGEVKWHFRTVGETYFPKGEVQKGALVEDGIVFFGSRDYNIYALDAKTGRGRWNMKEGGSWVIATPIVYKGKLYFGTSDTHRFYCLSISDGKIIWQIPLPMRVYGSAVEYNGLVYFGCFDGKMRGVDHETGKVKWEFQTTGSKLNYSKIYNEEGKFKDGFELYGKDYIETERLIHTLGSILSTPVIQNNIIYFGSSDGGLYAVPVN